MPKKIFVSLPMKNRSVEEIRIDMNNILDEIRPMYEEVGENVELIDTIWPDGPSDDIQDEGCWYLGRSIMALSEADAAIFHPGWREARGCIIEHMVCAMYNIPYFDISMNYEDLDKSSDIDDQTHDWDIVGQANAALSKTVADAEGLSENDIFDIDVEDALGFEHDDVDDLIESDPDLNPYAQHSEINIAVMDEFDELINSDILEPGEYNADIR